jgi:hypothetical protein
LCFAVLFLFAMLVPTGTSMAQGFGVLGGATFAKINVSGDEGLNVHFDEKLEPAVGVFATFPLHDQLSIDPELVADVKGSHLDVDDIHESIRLTYLELPVLVRYAPPQDSALRWLRILGGPYGAYLLDASSHQRLSDRRLNLNDTIQTFDVGWVAGLGAHAGRLDVDLRYSGSVVDISTRRDLGVGLPWNDAIKYRNRAFVLVARYHIR